MAAPSSSAFSESFSFVPDGTRRIPEDTVFYTIYIDGVSSPSPVDPLFSLHLHILDSVVSPFLHDYIWQHEPFNLSLYSAGIPHLHGKVRYGDSVDDEWFAVFLLYEISRRVPAASIRVWDSDGEFLLIEAAFSLPRWINPGNSGNRVFIRRGQLHILPKKHFPSNPTLEQALEALESGKIQTIAPDDVQEAVNRRISGYPERARTNMHRARVRVPLPVAQVLRHEPSLISLAVEGFYDRDIDSMKHASRMEKFLIGEGGAVDIVQISVVMSRAMYAQLARQSFSAPKCFPMPSRDQGPVLYAEAELGMKIACGLEMLYQSRIQSADEIKVSSVDAFKAALEKQGYFEGLLPGSKEHRRRMEEAMERHKNSVVFARARDVMAAPIKRIEEILSLNRDVGDFVGAELPPSDDDSWLYDGEEELNSAILERQKEMEIYELKRKGKEKPENGENSEEEFSLGEMAKTMQSFVEKISSFEGAEVPSNRREVELDVGMFLKDMESVLGEFSGLREDLEEDGCCSSSGFGSDDWEEEEEEGESEAAAFMESYSESLNKELGATTLKNTFVRTDHVQGSTNTEGGEEMTPVDVEFNLVKSLIDSYSSQQGRPGPASNLLGLMGFNLPSDPGHSSS